MPVQDSTIHAATYAQDLFEDEPFAPTQGMLEAFDMDSLAEPGLRALGMLFGYPSILDHIVGTAVTEDPETKESVSPAEMAQLAFQIAKAKTMQAGGGLMQMTGELPLVPPDMPWPENRPWPGVAPEMAAKGRLISERNPQPDISNLPSWQRDIITGSQYLMGAIPGTALGLMGGPTLGPLLALGYGLPWMTGYQYNKMRDQYGQDEEASRRNALGMGLLQSYGLGTMKKPGH